MLGNDINPQTKQEIVICSILLYIGAFLLASIFGSISAEMERAKDLESSHQSSIDFVLYSFEIH